MIFVILILVWSTAVQLGQVSRQALQPDDTE